MIKQSIWVPMTGNITPLGIADLALDRILSQETHRQICNTSQKKYILF